MSKPPRPRDTPSPLAASEADGAVSRAAGKLRAALSLFDLAAAVKGEVAVDVGASTGGFTETLLAAGAARVFAVDVGHDQLHPRLRADPRVASHEGLDWKTLDLDVLPGPFGFFTVDVSFVAARNMLRSLAFRLRPGAEGVVLVKPQFELPSDKARLERLGDPNLRRTALARFQEKAESLGFTVVAHADSPVAGREGTVEILTHVRFLGRSEKLPQPGEKKAPAGARPRRKQAPPQNLEDPATFFAVVPPGLEDLLARELAGRGLVGAPTIGGVSWRGPWNTALVANLHSRLATRVLVRLGENLEAESFATFRRRVGRLPWERYVDRERKLRANISVTRCRLYHTGALAEQLWLGIADRLGGDVTVAASAEEAEQLLVVRGEGNAFTVSVDTSGESLYRRGWREEGGVAPLRETLAASILALCAWQPGEPVFDPVCGSGTLVLEAATQGVALAPGLRRSFAFERFPGFSPLVAAWQALRTEAETAHEAARAAAPESSASVAFAGRDRDPEAIAVARRNAERAGLSAHVSFEVAPLGEAAPLGPPGLLLANPPYGHRLGTVASARALYRELGRVLRTRFAGWRAGILVPDRAMAAALGLRPTAAIPLRNGGLKLDLLRFGGPPNEAPAQTTSTATSRKTRSQREEDRRARGPGGDPDSGAPADAASDSAWPRPSRARPRRSPRGRRPLRRDER
jgi:putative N6-adenine-specific DNA methylase